MKAVVSSNQEDTAAFLQTGFLLSGEKNPNIQCLLSIGRQARLSIR